MHRQTEWPICTDRETNIHRQRDTEAQTVKPRERGRKAAKRERETDPAMKQNWSSRRP